MVLHENCEMKVGGNEGWWKQEMKDDLPGKEVFLKIGALFQHDVKNVIADDFSFPGPPSSRDFSNIILGLEQIGGYSGCDGFLITQRRRRKLSALPDYLICSGTLELYLVAGELRRFKRQLQHQ